MANLQIAFWTAIVLGIVALLLWCTMATIRGVKNEIQTERAKGEPWLILWVGLAFQALNVLVCLYAWLASGGSKSSMTEKLDTIPFCWLPFALGMTCFVVHGLQISKANRRKVRETGIRQENLSVFVLALAAAPLVQTSTMTSWPRNAFTHPTSPCV